MTRIALFITALSLAFTVPSTAAAHCGTNQGSFAVTCEQGVKVYRHNTMSSVPAPLSQGEAYVQVEKIRARTARAQINAQARAAARTADLRERELAIKDYRARVYDRNTRRTSYSIGTYYNRGFHFGQPVRIRRGSLNIQH